MGLEDLSHNFLTGSLEELVKWARRSSVWPATFGLACCAIEMMAAGAADFDLARFGMEVFRGSPRQADLMVVAGRVSQKMAPVLRQVYDQMVEPKWVISMGVCASTGGMFNNYAIVQGVDQIVPVDVYAPGLPAEPADAHPRHLDPAREDPPRRDHPAAPGRDRRRHRPRRRARPGGMGRTAVGSRPPGNAALMAGRGERAPSWPALDGVAASTSAAARRSSTSTRDRYLEVAGRCASTASRCAPTCAPSTTCATSTARCPRA